MTEPQQKRIAVDVLRTAAATRPVGALFWYTDRDLPAQQSTEDYFGLRRVDGSRKPAWRAFRRTVDELGAPARFRTW